MATTHTAGFRRCATDQPSTGDRKRIADFEAAYFQNVQESSLDLVIPVAFIHVTDGADGHITAEQRAQQIQVLNDCYAPMGIRFQFDEGKTQFIDSAAFFTMGHKSKAERQCKAQNQGLDPELGLNFYTAGPGGNLLGWATFPYEMEGDPTMDGVVILHSTLPGGALANFNLGRTAVHEVGHWLGLYHTFQDGCFGEGDEVGDTPAHGGPNTGKPGDEEHPHNLCPTAPAGSLCPIHNYMNYVDDAWMTEFTDGQRTRVFAQIGMFRTQLMGGSQLQADAGGRVAW
ncbi:zinc metalloprotease [Pseudorhodoferax sp.]|uniref:zinc metalloprotease n=1 Tax=Pseudorhodoferax sp. TaxID=1993553 RepID=UPI002DD6B102|nr:zinc metalloprotease [Pseudorhodoferax sp.]